MKTAAVIAEYNPFHNGHLYHLNQTRQVTGASYILAMMSGCFVQRGLPAVADAHARARMALLGGADAVLELPVFYSTASAEHFAMGAVSLLESLHSVDYLCFGSECGDISLLKALADILDHLPPACERLFRSRLREGLSYPAARAAALEEYLQGIRDTFSGFHTEQLLEALSRPNNILGIEYIRALNRLGSPIEPVTMARVGAGYHDTSLTALYPSASGIRKALKANAVFSPEALLETKDLMPREAADILTKSPLLFADDFSSLLRYKLLLEQDAGYTRYADVSQDISDRMKNNLEYFESFTQFASLLKTRELAHTRIFRALLHILLNITKEQMLRYTGSAPKARRNYPGYLSYARLLGFRQDSSELLAAIKANGDLPLISKLADARSLLPPGPLSMLKEDVRAAHIYGAAAAEKTGQAALNEYRRPVIIV